MTTSTNATIQLLEEQIARMGDQIARLQHATNVDQDLQIQGQVATTTFGTGVDHFELWDATNEILVRITELKFFYISAV